MNNMFSSYLAPHLNISASSPRRQPQQQPQCSDNASVASFATHSTAGSRSSRGSNNGNKGAKAQDYQVLVTELKKRHAHFQQARSQLASSLMRMGEYHVRQGEYDEAMMALRDRLNENRSVVCSGLNSLPSLEISDTGEESLVSGMTTVASHSQWSGGANTPRGSCSASVASSHASPYLASINAAASRDTHHSSNPHSSSKLVCCTHTRFKYKFIRN